MLLKKKKSARNITYFPTYIKRMTNKLKKKTTLNKKTTKTEASRSIIALTAI